MAARNELEQRISEAQAEAIALSVAKVRAVMAEFGLTAADIGDRSAGSLRVSGAAESKMAVEYHHAATGDNWTCRDLQPRWLKAALAAAAEVKDIAV